MTENEKYQIYLTNLVGYKMKLSEDDLNNYYDFLNKSQQISLSNIAEEKWYELPNHEGVYSISNFCRIKRVQFDLVFANGSKRTYQEQIMQSRNQRGYIAVALSRNLKSTPHRIHRLFASLFIPNPNNLPYINHINGIRNDNRLSNLEWCNNSDNQLHAYRVLGKVHPRPMLGRRGSLCPTSKPVMQFDLLGRFIKEYPAVAEAARMISIDQSCISIAIRNGTTSKGYIWKFKNQLT